MAISQGSQGRGAIFTEINITPLTDIFLVLLIIMMVIAPMFQQANQDIKVPTINSGQAVEENTVTVEVTKDGKFFVNGESAEQAGLLSKLKPLVATSENKQLIVRADKDTENAQVMQVFESASEAGFEKLTIAGEPLSATRQQELTAPPADTDTDSKPQS